MISCLVYLTYSVTDFSEILSNACVYCAPLGVLSPNKLDDQLLFFLPDKVIFDISQLVNTHTFVYIYTHTERDKMCALCVCSFNTWTLHVNNRKYS
jgi:hypothetical protein